MLGKRKRGSSSGAAAAGRQFRKVKPVDEVVFDLNERHHYLTGFHKRKQARVRHAQELAVKQEREDKLQQRKELREERKRQVEEHVKAVSQAVKKSIAEDSEYSGSEDNDDDDADANENEQEWAGFKENSILQTIDREDKYSDSESDEDATVTVEAVNITRDGFQKANDNTSEDHVEVDEEEDGDIDVKKTDRDAMDGKKEKRVWTREKPKVPKKKRKKFRYESAEDRKQERARIRVTKAKRRAKREGK